MLLLQQRSDMVPVTVEKNKENLNARADESQSVSPRGVKRSAEEGDEFIDETNTEKRVRPSEKDMGMLQAYIEEENQQNKKGDEKKMATSMEESNDIANSETSFMDLADDVFMNIFAYLDLPSRLNLRVNKRLDRLHFAVKNTMKGVDLNIELPGTQLVMEDRRTPVPSANLRQLEEGLRRFALNTFVDVMWIAPDSQHYRVIDALCHFKADCLILCPRMFPSVPISHLTLPSFLALAQNVREVEIGLECPSLAAKDLCVLRKTMLEGCRMESFEMKLAHEMRIAFMKECFGVNIEEVSQPDPGTIYHCEDESLELYNGPGVVRFDDDRPTFKTSLIHFEDDLKTEVCGRNIIFKKLKVVEKPDDELKVKLNELIKDEEDSDDEQ